MFVLNSYMRYILSILMLSTFIYSQCGAIGYACGGLDSDGCCPQEPIDCAGVCGGPSFINDFGVCQSPADFVFPDCEGVFGGLAYEDLCGICDADPSNDCELDCNCEWGGNDFSSCLCDDFDYDLICDDAPTFAIYLSGKENGLRIN